MSLLARNNEVYRLLRPRHLCFLRRPHDSEELHGVDVRSVAEWETDEGSDSDSALRYLFVAYSTEHFSHSSPEDLTVLHAIAETAARAAKIPAYWVAASCMQDSRERESDVSFSPQRPLNIGYYDMGGPSEGPHSGGAIIKW